MIEASIDIGTNTILLLIAELEPEFGASLNAPGAGSALRKIKRVLLDQQTIVRLGQGVSRNKFLLPEAMARAYQCLAECKEQCKKAGVSVIRAVATSASRDAHNAVEFYQRIHNELGIDVQVIAGESEARLGFLGGLMPHQNRDETVLVDIGGGSTEFVTNVAAQSVDVGSVRATESFLEGCGDPYSKDGLSALQEALRMFWPSLNPKLQSQLHSHHWTGVAGTITTLAAVEQSLFQFEAEKIDGFLLTRSSVANLFNSLAALTRSERASNPVIGEGRADVIVGGAAVLLSAMDFFGKSEITVSTRGLRYGLLLSARSAVV